MGFCQSRLTQGIPQCSGHNCKQFDTLHKQYYTTLKQSPRVYHKDKAIIN